MRCRTPQITRWATKPYPVALRTWIPPNIRLNLIEDDVPELYGALVAALGGFLVGKNDAFLGGGVFDEGTAGLVGKRVLEKAEDEGIDKIDRIRSFLKQRTEENSTMEQTLEQLSALVGTGGKR